MMMFVKVCAPTQLLLQISQKGLLLNLGVFIVWKRERERGRDRQREKEKDSPETVLSLPDKKWMHNNRGIVKTLAEEATDLLVK